MAAIAEIKTVNTNDSSTGFGCKTILFNCNCHSFDQVIQQLVKAIHCNPLRAEELALIAHRKGRVIVYSGHKERCEAVSATLEEIGLRTMVEE